MYVLWVIFILGFSFASSFSMIVSLYPKKLCTWTSRQRLRRLSIQSYSTVPRSDIKAETVSNNPPSSPTSSASGISMWKGIPQNQWMVEAKNHGDKMDDLLYPKVLRNTSPKKNQHSEIKFKARTHAVPSHPIYNFLHSYYRYSPQELRLYSPGLGHVLEVSHQDDSQQSISQSTHPMDSKNKSDEIDKDTSSSVMNRYSGIVHIEHMSIDSATDVLYLTPTAKTSTSKRYGTVAATTSRDILFATMMRPPHFGCFGLHEWAMLYSNRTTPENIDPTQRHQAQLSLRVSQETIDQVVEQTGLSCTHFDAWRFFHPAAQPLNINNPMTRAGQVHNEQPACIHATMDLFKYAYQLYPFVSSHLLRRCLAVAVAARKIDMRASPYNVSHVEGCEEPICVETTDGKLHYVEEQKKLFDMSFSLRKELHDVYCNYLNYIQ